MGLSTSQLRQAWKDYECNSGAMTVIDFGPDRIRVAPPTADAWRALAMVLQAHGYNIRLDDTDSYNCRDIKGGGGKSLHSFGIALDVNWDTNPFKETPDNRSVRFSQKPTQHERAAEVKIGKADTDMTPEMIADVRAIKTAAGKPIFNWGGDWKTLKDAMHFELDVSPDDLKTGVDWNTVKKPVLVAEAEDMSPTKGSVVASEEAARPVLSDDLVRMLVAALIARSSVAPANTPPPAASTEKTLELLLAALLGKPLPQPADGGGKTPPPILSPVDNALGGEALAGKKTALAIAAYVVLQLLTIKIGGVPVSPGAGAAAGAAAQQAGTSIVEAGSQTYNIMTTLIAAFGGLGLTAKIDRVARVLGLIVAKSPPPAASK